MTPELSLGLDMDEPIPMKKNVRLGPFQTQILECRIKPLVGGSANVMVMPLRAGESQPGRVSHLPKVASSSQRYPTSKERCLIEDILGQPSRHGGRVRSLPCTQQLGPKQGTAVHQHNAPGRGRSGISLSGSHQSVYSGFEWCSL